MESETVFIVYYEGKGFSYPDHVYKTRKLADSKLERIRNDYVRDEYEGKIKVVETWYHKEDGIFRIDYIDMECPLLTRVKASYQIYECELEETVED